MRAQTDNEPMWKNSVYTVHISTLYKNRKYFNEHDSVLINSKSKNSDNSITVQPPQQQKKNDYYQFIYDLSSYFVWNWIKRARCQCQETNVVCYFIQVHHYTIPIYCHTAAIIISQNVEHWLLQKYFTFAFFVKYLIYSYSDEKSYLIFGSYDNLQFYTDSGTIYDCAAIVKNELILQIKYAVLFQN